MGKKLRNSVNNAPIEELRNLLIQHVSSHIKSYLQKTNTGDPKQLKFYSKDSSPTTPKL